MGIPYLGHGSGPGIDAGCIEVSGIREPHEGLSEDKAITGIILPACSRRKRIHREESGEVFPHGDLVSGRTWVIDGLGGFVSPDSLVYGTHPGAVIRGKSGGGGYGLGHSHPAAFDIRRIAAGEGVLSPPLVQKAVGVL